MAFASFLSLPSLPSWASSFLTNNTLYNNQTSRTILFTLGAGYLFSKIFNIARGILSFVQIPKDLAARYGKGTWAFVTGASSGIGQGFALELANRGFNIVLVGRQQATLESVAQEIKTKYPGIQTRIVLADFVDAIKEGFAENLYEQVRDLDISILVNNAGMPSGTRLYMDYEFSTIRNLLLVNSLSPALITRAFLPHLANRTQRSAIIAVASVTIATPLPRSQIYSASKTFLDYLTRGIAYEHPNIDILSFNPGFVSTKMVGNRKSDIETISVEECVDSALSALGHTDQTFGHWKHRLMHFKLAGMPDFMVRAYVKKRMGINNLKKK